MLKSIDRAALTMVFPIALGAPADHALARLTFHGANAYRMAVLLTRAFPVGILALLLAVSSVRLGICDRALGVTLIHTALALPFAVLIAASLSWDSARTARNGRGVRASVRFAVSCRCLHCRASPQHHLCLRDFPE